MKTRKVANTKVDVLFEEISYHFLRRIENWTLEEKREAARKLGQFGTNLEKHYQGELGIIENIVVDELDAIFIGAAQ